MESARIAAKLACIRREQQVEQLARLQAMTRAPACCSGGAAVKQNPAEFVPLESVLLAARVAGCPETIRFGPTLESVRINRADRCTRDASTTYVPPLDPFVCPPTPVEQLNANLPKPSTRCLYGNKPTQPAAP